MLDYVIIGIASIACISGIWVVVWSIRSSKERHRKAKLRRESFLRFKRDYLNEKVAKITVNEDKKL